MGNTMTTISCSLTTLGYEWLIEYYGLRFQIEMCFEMPNSIGGWRIS